MARAPQPPAERRSPNPSHTIPTGALDASRTQAEPGSPSSDQTAEENVIRAAELRESRAKVNRDESARPNEKRNSSPSPRAVPPEVAQHYTRRGARFYLPNDQLAIIDDGRVIKTPLENPAVIKDMLEMHRERGRETVELAGSENFRRMAWQVAESMGMRTHGYPMELELLDVADEPPVSRQVNEAPDAEVRPPRAPEQIGESSATPVASARAARADETRVSGPQAAVLDDDPARMRLPDSSRAVAVPAPALTTTDTAEPIAPDPRARTGQLLEHGEANYRFDPRKPRSYFVKIDTPDGPVTQWGADLGRAIKKSLSNVQIGEEVVVRDLGERPVVVSRPVLNEYGDVVRSQKVTARMNRWSVERVDFIEERSRVAAIVRNSDITPQEAVRDRPELEGTYDELAQASAEAPRFYVHAEDQRRFVTRVRAILANEIERGEPLTQRPDRGRVPERESNSPRERALAQERLLF